MEMKMFTPSFTGYISSWQLTRVDFPNARYLNFDYSPDEYIKHSFFATGYINDMTPPCYSYPSLTYYLSGNSQVIIKRQILSAIHSDNGFSVNMLVIGTDEKLYKRITIEKSSDEIRYDLEYDNEHNRSLLMKVLRNNQKYYSFDYLNKYTIPDFVNDANQNPTAQDNYGYFNGKTNNSHTLDIPLSQYNCDKNSYFDAAASGALSRISYPTGGYSEISYEPNQIKSSEAGPDNVKFNRRIHLNLQTDNVQGSLDKETSFSYTFENAVYARISHKVVGYDVGSHMRLEMSGPVPDWPNFYHIKAPQERITQNTDIPSFSPYLLVEITGDEVSGEYLPLIRQGNSGGLIEIEPGTYQFDLNTNMNYKDTYGEITIDFYDPESEFVNYTVGGIRISKIENYPAGTAESKTTRYFNYNDEEGFSRAKLMQPGITGIRYPILFNCDMENNIVPNLYNRLTYSYKTFNPVNLNNGVPVFYPLVEEFSDVVFEEILPAPIDTTIPPFLPLMNEDSSLVYEEFDDPSENLNRVKHYSNGKTVRTYSFCNYTYKFDKETAYPLVPEGSDKKIGRLLGELIIGFHNDDSTNYILKRINNSYAGILNDDDTQYYLDKDMVTEDHPNGLRIGYNMKQEGFLEIINQSELNDYYELKSYKEYDNDFLQTINQNISYFDNGDTVVGESRFYYDEYNQLIRKSDLKSSGDSIHTTYKYPYDESSTTCLEMVNRNMLSPTIQTEVFLGDNQIGGNKTNYGFVNVDEVEVKTSGSILDGALIVPANIEQWQETTGFRKVGSYDAYGENGNLLQFHKEDDINVSIVWDYYNVNPIAKIVNAEYSNVKALLDSYGGLMLNSVNNLRDEPVMKNAQVTTYAYHLFFNKPILQTDPNGKKTFFSYDDLGRLKRIKDHNEHILKEYVYNYAKNDVASFSYNVYNDIIQISPNISDEFVNYEWDFGDGATSSMTEIPFEGVSHTYSTAGYYTVKLKVTYADTKQSEFEETIRVLPEIIMSYSSTTDQITLNWNQVPGLTRLFINKKVSGADTTVLDDVNATSYTEGNLSPGNSYYYQLTIQDGNSFFTTDEFRASTLLATPVISYQDITQTSVQLNWGEIDGALNYVIHLSTEGGAYNQIGQTISNVFTYSVTGLIAGTTYCFKIEATNTDHSSTSDSVCITTAPIEPTLSHVSSTANSITLEWDHSKGQDYYMVTRSSSIDGNYSFVTIPALPSNVTTYTDTDTELEPGTNYYYKVDGYNDFSGSLSSPLSTYTAPSAPVIYNSSVANNSLSLNWNQPASELINGYDINSSSSSGGPYSLIGSTTGTNYVNSSLNYDSNDYYTVEAKNDYGATKSDPLRLRVLPEINMNYSSTTNQITLNWNQVSNLDSLKLIRKVNGSDFEIELDPGATSYTDGNLSSGTSYYYQLIARDGNSSYTTNDLRAPTQLDKAVITYADIEQTSAQLNWSAIYGTYQYIIYKSTEGGAYEQIGWTLNDLTYSVTGLTAGTNYCFKIESTNTDYTSTSDSVCITTAPVESVLSHASSTKNSITISWSNSIGHTAYSVLRSDNNSSSGNFTFITPIPGLAANVTSYTDSNLDPGENYCYKVLAYNTYGSTESNILCARTVPEAPTISYGTTTSNSITLNWNNTEEYISAYDIYRSNSSNVPLVTPFATVNSSISTFTDENLNPGTQYCYKVAARNTSGSSASNALCLTTNPQVPNLTVGNIEGYSILLLWNDVSGESYNVYKSSELIINLPANTTSYNVGSLSPATYYCFKVAAVGNFGESESNVVCERTNNPCPSNADICGEGPPGVSYPPFANLGKVYYDLIEGAYYKAISCGIIEWHRGIDPQCP